jgi:tRNA (guanine37-N1)-methyltransferase
MFKGYFDESIMKRAQEKGILNLQIHNLRDWATDSHRSVDDKPYGGGAGMVMMVDVIGRAVEDLREAGSRVVLLSPQGELLKQSIAEELAGEDRLILISGHYEGVDERVRELLVDREVSIGEFVISNGSLAAMVLVDAVVRLLPGVVGDSRSVREESFTDGILDYPQYTRPRTYGGLDVPAVLLEGDHKKIARWRRREALRKTLMQRPELLEKASLSDEDRELLEQL